MVGLICYWSTKMLRVCKMELSGKGLKKPCKNPSENHLFNVFRYCKNMGPQGIVSYSSRVVRMSPTPGNEPDKRVEQVSM